MSSGSSLALDDRHFAHFLNLELVTASGEIVVSPVGVAGKRNGKTPEGDAWFVAGTSRKGISEKRR